MKEVVRQLFTTLSPVIVCFTVTVCSQCVRSNPSGTLETPTYLVPKRTSLDNAYIAMLSAQRDRYTTSLRDYQAALSVTSPRTDTAELRSALSCASKQYEFVAQETADTAFRASGLPRTLPKP